MGNTGLLARLKQGGTLAQIAEESGVTLDDVVEKLAAAMKKKLSKLIEADKLEPNQARRLLDEAVKRLTQSLREFRQATIDKAKTNGRPAWASSARLYKDIPLTLEDVASALGVSTEQLQKLLHSDGGIRSFLKERGVNPERLISKLLGVAKKRLTEQETDTNAGRVKVNRLVAELKRRLFAELHLKQAVKRLAPDARARVKAASFQPFDIEIVAHALGLSTQELRRFLSSGHSVAEIAEKQGISLDEVVRALSSGPHHQDSGEAKIRESTAGVSRKPSSDCKACGCSSKHLCGLTAWNT